MAGDTPPERKVTRRKARIRRFRWLLAVAFAVFMGIVVYRSLQVAGYRCTICVSFRGASACRTVDGPTERDARMGAMTNACAQLVSGVTETMACERTDPTTSNCSAMN